MKIKATVNNQEPELDIDEQSLVKAGYVKAKKEHKRWRANPHARYFFIDSVGDIVGTFEYAYNSDCNRYAAGNYYQTEELAQAALDRQLDLVRVNDRILELNEGRKGTSFIDYLVGRAEFNSNPVSGRYIQGFSLANMADDDVANQIISECESDLKIIFGV